MNIHLALFFVSFLTTTICFSQDSTFYIKFPDNWVQFQRNDVLNSVKNKYELSDKTKEEILANSNSTQLYGYAAPSKPNTLYRPNIQVLLIKNQAQNFGQFKKGIEMSLEGFKTKISDLQILDSFHTVTIDNKQAVYGKISGFVMTKSGEKAQLITRIYAIPVGKFFYQLTLNDSGDYDCEEEYKKVVHSLKLK